MPNIPRAGARALAILLLSLPAVPAIGQTTTGTVSGLVVDTRPLPIPGATVTIQEIHRAAQRTITSNHDGSFEFAGLLPGDYRLSTSLQGFATTQVDLRLDVNQRLRVDSQRDGCHTAELNGPWFANAVSGLIRSRSGPPDPSTGTLNAIATAQRFEGAFRSGSMNFIAAHQSICVSPRSPR